MEKSKSGSLLKFLVFSIFGVVFFFINVDIGGASKVPLIHLIDKLKELLGLPAGRVLVMIITIAVLIMDIWSRFDSCPKFIQGYFKKKSLFNTISYILAAIFSIMVIFNVGFGCVLNEAVGAASVKIARDVFFSIVVSGFFVTALLEFGLLEFIGTLLEPIMRVIFKLPGKASIDALTSFVCSPAVGVMVTNSLYKGKVYTAKEAVAITTGFSFVSLGAYAFLSGLAGCPEYYSQLIFTSLVLAFVVAAIMIRIPPISKKGDTFYDGVEQTPEQRKSKGYSAEIFKEAYNVAMDKAGNASMMSFVEELKSAFMFGMKVVSYVVSLSVLCLILSNYTPVITWLGMPMRPILELLRIPDAAAIAPSTLAAFVAMSLPSTLISGTGVSAMAAFFIVVLSTCQVIFFTESANAMLDSEIPVNFVDLLIIFVERTVLLIPLVAIATHIIF